MNTDTNGGVSPLKARVSGRVRFAFYRDLALWYKTDDGWEFPVPISDTANAQGGSATFHAEDKGITYMRWIRKHLEFEARQRAETSQEQSSGPTAGA